MATIPTPDTPDVPEPPAPPKPPIPPEPGKPLPGPEIEPPDRRKNQPIIEPEKDATTALGIVAGLKAGESR